MGGACSSEYSSEPAKIVKRRSWMGDQRVGLVEEVKPPPVADAPEKVVGKASTDDAEESKETWQDLVADAAKDKLGWRVWKGRVLLCQASKKYGRLITIRQGSQIPFNETSGWYTCGGQDHWFEIPLNIPEIELKIGLYITGRLFTTRMPRGLDDQPGNYKGVIPPGATDKRRLMQKIKDNSIVKVFVLVEDHEFAKGKSSNLLQFYESLGAQAIHTPIQDFSTPSFETEKNNIEALNISIAKGENCLVHCWGGSGRTGTVVLGAVANLGVCNMLKYCRRFKSVYLDIREQEQFVERQLIIVTGDMLNECPQLTTAIIHGHLEELCSNKSNVFIVSDSDFTDKDVKQLWKIFCIIDKHGHDEVVSIDEIFSFANSLKSRVSGSSVESSITIEALHTVFGHFDKSVRKVPSDHDSVTFQMFLRMLKLHVKKTCEKDCAKRLSQTDWNHHKDADLYKVKRPSIHVGVEP